MHEKIRLNKKSKLIYKPASVFLLYAEELHVLHDAEQYTESLHHHQIAWEKLLQLDEVFVQLL